MGIQINTDEADPRVLRIIVDGFDLSNYVFADGIRLVRVGEDPEIETWGIQMTLAVDPANVNLPGEHPSADLPRLWNEQAAASSAVAAFATQTVYGQQQAILQAQITRQSETIAETSKQVAELGRRLAAAMRRL